MRTSPLSSSSANDVRGSLRLIGTAVIKGAWSPCGAESVNLTHCCLVGRMTWRMFRIREAEPRCSRRSLLFEKLRRRASSPAQSAPLKTSHSERCVGSDAVSIALVGECSIPGRVERRAPAALVVLRQLPVEALAVHAHGNVADAEPGV